MKYKNLENVRGLLRGLAGVAATLLVGMAHAAPVDFAKLQVLKGLQDGQWQIDFSTTPANSSMPARTEKGCASVANYLQQATKEVAAFGACTSSITQDLPGKAEIANSCTINAIPGITGAEMKFSYPVTISRTGPNEVKVVTSVPNPQTGQMMMVQQTAKRLGACSASQSK